MVSPPISVFLTTIAMQPALRQRQDYILRILQIEKIPFTPYDLASDEEAKRLWRRKAPRDKQQLPGILVGGKFAGTFEEFEEAVEYNELDRFLRLNETWHESDDSDNDFSTSANKSGSTPGIDSASNKVSTPFSTPVKDPSVPPKGAKPILPARPIGVPGAMSPLQMTPEHMKQKILARPSPDSNKEGKKKDNDIPVNKRTGEMDLGEEMPGFGLQGVKVTEDELLDLVKELGMNDDDAGDLVKGLGGEEKGKGNAKEKREEIGEK